VNIELVVDSREGEVEIAVLEGDALIELHKESNERKFQVGDIYLGKVRNVNTSLNACFVDVGYEKDAFLHYLDLGPQFSSLKKYVKFSASGRQTDPMLDKLKMESDINKKGKIDEQVKSGMHIIVQIAKEPISTKGPRLASEITLAGRYIVLAPFSDKISISSKIKSKQERHRLERLMTSIVPTGFGVIVRTVAEGKKVADLDKDLRSLVERWVKMHSALQKAKPPKRLLGELNRTSALLRDIMVNNFKSIHVNDEALAANIKDYLLNIAPDKANIVRHYSEKIDIFDRFGIHKQIKASFGRQVNMKSGAYLIVEHTEAMHVIDVNSGNRKAVGQDQEQNAFETNLESAKTIARVLKLRDMGGIIVVDFIDMKNRDNRKKLHTTLKDYLKDDKAKSNVLAPSRFGLIEITRQRVRPETNIVTSEKCPTCGGKGEIEASILLTDEIKHKLELIADKMGKGTPVALCLHPFIAAYLTKESLAEKKWWNPWQEGDSKQKQWSERYNITLEVRPMSSYTFMEHRFFNAEDEEIL
jgi:ribonuclease G